jgi:hypothetical protein
VQDIFIRTSTSIRESWRSFLGLDVQGPSDLFLSREYEEPIFDHTSKRLLKGGIRFEVLSGGILRSNAQVTMGQVEQG